VATPSPLFPLNNAKGRDMAFIFRPGKRMCEVVRERDGKKLCVVNLYAADEAQDLEG
jgi:hypothetical protein